MILNMYVKLWYMNCSGEGTISIIILLIGMFMCVSVVFFNVDRCSARLETSRAMTVHE